MTFAAGAEHDLEEPDVVSAYQPASVACQPLECSRRSVPCPPTPDQAW